MRRRRAVSLIETVIGISIASIVSGVALGFYVNAHKAETHGTQALDSLHAAQRVLVHLLDDLHALAPPPGTPPAAWVTFRDDDGSGSRELAFHRWTNLDETTGRATRRLVTYRVAPPRASSIVGSEGMDVMRVSGVDRTRLVHEGVRNVSVEPRFGYWRTEDGRRRYVESRRPPAAADGSVVRFTLKVAFTVEQFTRTGEPTTSLPVGIHVAPRALNARLGDHWLGHFDD